MKEYYNNLYSKQSNAARLRLIPFYQKIAEYINPEARIIDLGCGNGMLAKLSKWKTYTGFDFSEVAIAKAKTICPQAEFICSDINNYIRIVNYDTVIMTEFLEHIENDIKIISVIKQGAKVIISVPNNEPLFNGKPKSYPTHQRNYTIEILKDRYNNIEFSETFIFEHWIMAIGIKK